MKRKKLLLIVLTFLGLVSASEYTMGYGTECDHRPEQR